MKIDERVLEILRCPICFADIYFEKEELICKRCGRRYRVLNGILDMLHPIEPNNLEER
ncbi:MAG: Trm112 family protein [bacterium]